MVGVMFFDMDRQPIKEINGKGLPDEMLTE